jgi:NitT/TauT family transport system substrate-binding protein
MVPWAGYSPLNIAATLGFWEEEGISVQVLNFVDIKRSNDALISGETDISIDMLGNSVGLFLDGNPIKIIGETDWSHGGDRIIVKNDFELANIKGASVGIFLRRPSVMYFLWKFLQENNADFEDVHVIAVESSKMTNNFINNRFPIIINYDPHAQRAIKKGNGRAVRTSADWEGVIPEGFVILEENFAGIPKKDIKAFFKGWIRAVEWMNDPANFDAFVEILNTRTFATEDNFSSEVLKEFLDSVKIHNADTQLARNKNGVKQYLKELHNFLGKTDMLTRDFSADSILDNSILIETLEEMREEAAQTQAALDAAEALKNATAEINGTITTDAEAHSATNTVIASEAMIKTEEEMTGQK